MQQQRLRFVTHPKQVLPFVTSNESINGPPPLTDACQPDCEQRLREVEATHPRHRLTGRCAAGASAAGLPMNDCLREGALNIPGDSVLGCKQQDKQFDL